jgi:hypothetical protein
MEVERWTELVDSMEEQGFDSFHVSLEYCYALISEARAVNKRTRHKLPVAYAVWRPLIEGGIAQKNSHATPIVLEPRPYGPEIAQLAQHGDELYQMTEFDSWYFDPFDSVKSYINPYLMSKNSSSSSRSRRRKGGQRAEEQKTKQETIVTEALEKAVDNKWRLLYESRLRRQGALFQVVERTKDAQLISAVASALHPDSGLPPQQQPFLRAMMHHTLENGFVRLMAEAIESGPFRSIPLNFSSEDDDFYF